MWGTSYQEALLKKTAAGLMWYRWPWLSLKPAGWFIQELAATTDQAPRTPEMATGARDQKCAHGGRRSHPNM
jgi:hypothetical protein